MPGVVSFSILSHDARRRDTCATAESRRRKFELTTLAKMGRFDQEVPIDMPAASDLHRPPQTISGELTQCDFRTFPNLKLRRRRRRRDMPRRRDIPWPSRVYRQTAVCMG